MNSDSRQNLPTRIDQDEHSSSNIIKYPNNTYPEELLEQSSGLDLREFINVLSRHKKLVLTTALITMLLALLITLIIPPTYRAASTLRVERYAANSNEILNAETSRSDRDFFETQIQLIQSKTLARRVIDKLKIDTKDTPTSLLAKIKQTFGSDSADAKTNSDQLELLFLENLSVKPVNNSQLLSVSYDASDPKLAADISNAISEEFVKQNLEKRFDTASSFKEYVTKNIEITRSSLEDAEKRLNAYARENVIVQNDDGKSATDLTLKRYAEDIVSAENERIEAEAIYKLALKSTNSISAGSVNDPYILSLKKAAARKETRYQKLRKKKTRSARRLRKQIDAIREQIANEGKSINSALESSFLAAQEKEKMLHAQYEKLKQKALNSQSKGTKYNRLLREVEINQLAYDKQLEQLMAANIAGKIGTNNITVIDKAGIPSRKFKPSLKMNLLFGSLLGLLLGMGIAFLREFIDDSVKDSDSLERLSGLPVLSQLPDVKNADPKKLALQTALEPRSMLAESIRSLRTSLRFSTRNGAPKNIFITSSAAAEGKSTIALNLATTYAQAGSNVLLIDADLRNPSIHKLLELNNQNGLTNYLASSDDIDNDIIHTCMIKHLNVITSGPIPPDPVELLSGGRMAELLKVAADQYDHIIIDGPPVLGLADALILSNLSDATLVAVEAGKTRKGHLLDSLKRLERANANILGSVLTRLSKAVNSGYNDSYYYYGASTSKTNKS